MYLAGPAVVAASAVTGRITDPRGAGNGGARTTPSRIAPRSYGKQRPARHCGLGRLGLAGRDRESTRPRKTGRQPAPRRTKQPCRTRPRTGEAKTPSCSPCTQAAPGCTETT